MPRLTTHLVSELNVCTLGPDENCINGLGHSNLITCLTSFFLEKKHCQTPKKKRKKSHLWCLTDESGFEIFCQTPKKKEKVQVLRIFFVRVIQSTTGS